VERGLKEEGGHKARGHSGKGCDGRGLGVRGKRVGLTWRARRRDRASGRG